MSRSANITTDPQVLAIAHRAGTRCHVLVARTNGGRPAVMDSRTFAASDAHRIDDWLDQHGAGQVLAVLPASAVVCRTCALPASDPAQLDQALALQAEAHVGALAPPHRVASAVLHAARDETTRSGLMIAWPESARVDLPDTTRPVRLTSDVVALAALLNGERPADPLVWLDRENGALAIALTHANGAAFRCAREDAESNESWQRNVGRALTETGLAVGHTDLFINAVVNGTKQKIASLNGDPSALFLPPEVITSARNRLDGTRNDPQWWQTYGVAAGALLARCDQLRPLTEIRDAPPIEKPSIIRKTAEVLSRPRTTAWCIAAAFVMLVFGPLIMHGLRLAVLSLRFDDISSQVQRVNDLDEKRQMYGELGRLAWPMTKLLADLASNTPEGIELNSVRINFNESITVNGTATPSGSRSGTELIALMQQYLEDTRIFSNTTLSWDDPNSFGQYEFTLSSRLAQPYVRVAYDDERDFAETTMQMRVDGIRPGDMAAAGTATDPDFAPRAASTDPNPDVRSLTLDEPDLPDPAGSTGPAVGSGTPTRRDTRRAGSGDMGGNLASRETDRGGGAGGLPPSVDIPEPLSEQQIKAMSLPDANAALTRVATARQHARLDDETSERLKREFTLLLRHIAELKKNP